MPTNKQGKVTGLRLTTEARAVLERVSSEGRFSQGDLVSALLEEHADNLDELEAKVASIRDRRKVYAERGRNAAGLKKGAWSSYEETWHVRDHEHHVVWTRVELEQLSDRFLDFDYWHKWFDHWVQCNEADQKRLANDLYLQLLSYPIPIRWRWLDLYHAIMWKHFSIDTNDAGSMTLPPLEEMVTETFQDLPFPTENKFRGVVLGLTDQLIMAPAGEWRLGVVSDMYIAADWEAMMKAIDTSMTILIDKMWNAADKGDDSDIEFSVWLGDKKRDVDTNLNCGDTPDIRRNILQREAKRITLTLGISMGDFIARLPQPHAAVIGDVKKVHDYGVKEFSIKDGPFPRSSALFRIAVVLQIAEKFGAVVTVSDLWAFAGVAKSQVSQLLKEWPMFFDRHSDENGPKRGGWIRLSVLGYDYFTPQRCVSEGDIQPSYMETAGEMFDDIHEDRRRFVADGGNPNDYESRGLDDHTKWATTCRHVLGLPDYDSLDWPKD